ncbi:dipeptide ABC transporter ATP-binding protein [Nakamurella leprariae]|uniref:ABC transporter ATP-binding protein n=1 Tax=Nakamurella leprariae TaxID=2803911 RepID=A0A939C2R3_9ACTN|nr:ABC transporter ATP-binding protein [Nakamurella leprariae]MBM9468564.1 ABC transporter ATP-binding protein [Nakamurella leprariae]
MEPLLQISGLEIDIPTRRGTVHAVRGLDLDIARGEIVGLVGESGSGKSMTAMAVVGLLPPAARITAGTISLGGRSIIDARHQDLQQVRRHDVGVVFQAPMKALNPRMMVGTQLREALLRAERPNLRAAMVRSLELLDAVGINRPMERLRQYPHELSGGLAQRVVIALALARHPRLLIADEPTTALDVSVQAQILDLLDHLRSTLDLAVLLVSHDLDVIRDRADRVNVINLGRIVERGPTLDVIDRPQHEYTQSLVAAMPSLARRRDLALVGLHRPSGAAAADGAGAGGTGDAPVADLDDGRPVDTPVDQDLVPIAEAIDVHKAFALPGGRLPWRPAHRRTAVEGVSVSIRPGESLGIVGESGSGKTTLARMLVGLAEPDSGEIRFDGRPVTALDREARTTWRRDVQFVFQDSTSALDPRRTVADSIGEPMLAAGVPATERHRRVVELLGEVGLAEHFGERRPRQLSGGQRQRVGIARALALDPRLIVADEPVSALDVSVQATVLNLLNRLRRRRNVAYAIISHDLGVISYLCTTVVVMYQGKVVDAGPVEQVLTEPSHDYTRMLLAAVPGARGRVAVPEVI